MGAQWAGSGRRIRGAHPGSGVRIVRALPVLVVAALAAVAWFGTVATAIADDVVDTPWVGVDERGTEVIELYFVFSSTCPHCQAAIPHVTRLAQERPWLRVWWLQADAGDPRVTEIATMVADEIGEPIRAVPTFMYCGTMVTGWDGPDGVGATLAFELEACRQVRLLGGSTTTSTSADEVVAVPGFGEVRSSSVPLPIFTGIVAGLDAFNPCAFFVLLFLLSLLVHARSRARMLTVGVTFVVVSGVLYFVFMAAWLNLFLVTDNLRWVTIVAGSLAIVLGVLSAKDFFVPGTGPSLAIPESSRPGLFSRMRGLLSIESLAPVLGATVVLAVVANSYELLCTAGLPMVFTRVLTLNDLPSSTYYGYLALYNVIYVVPLLAIVGVFVWTLGSRKLQPAEGRALKLLSGAMMLGLGGTLLLAPQLLEQVGTAVAVIAAALALTIVVVAVDRRLHPIAPRGSTKPG
jgi:hypothetical protein